MKLNKLFKQKEEVYCGVEADGYYGYNMWIQSVKTYHCYERTYGTKGNANRALRTILNKYKLKEK